MTAILSVWPQAQVLSAFGPWLSTNLTKQNVPCMPDFAKDNPVYGSFVIGWISALQVCVLEVVHIDVQQFN